MPKIVYLVRAVVTVMVLVAVAAACGGSEELTLEEYFHELQHIGDEASQEFDILDETGAGLRDNDFDGLRDFFDANEQIYRRVLAALGGIDPPGEVEAAHTEFVEAAEQMAGVVKTFSDGLADVDSIFERELAFGRVVGVEAASARMETACVAVEMIAAENSIQIDLGCN